MNKLHNIATRGELSIGITFPIESYQGSVPEMKKQEELAQRAEAAGFKALWFRDVPFHDPSFGDAGQMYDPFVYMTHIMNHTQNIALAAGSIILPLRHPVHTFKAYTSIQQLSSGRIILGVASGDRPLEYPGFNQDLSNRSALFRESFEYIKALQNDFPEHNSLTYGQIKGSIDVLPKHDQMPFLVTGHSGQSMDWIAKHSDGWLYYPRNINFLRQSMENWHQSLEQQEQSWKPYLQSLYIDLVKEKVTPTGIHLGFKSNVDYLKQYLETIRKEGVNHVAINLKFASLRVEEVIDMLGEQVIPHFK